VPGTAHLCGTVCAVGGCGPDAVTGRCMCTAYQPAHLGTADLDARQVRPWNCKCALETQVRLCRLAVHLLAGCRRTSAGVRRRQAPGAHCGKVRHEHTRAGAHTHEPPRRGLSGTQRCAPLDPRRWSIPNRWEQRKHREEKVALTRRSSGSLVLGHLVFRRP
jgi:hypothetical protein